MYKYKYNSGFMSRTPQTPTSEAHQQKIDEILSIYIQSEMIGRKNNNVNLKISSTSCTRPGPGSLSHSHHFPSSKTPRAVPVKLKSVSSFSHTQVPSSVASKSGHPPFSKSPRNAKLTSTAASGSPTLDKPLRYSSEGNVSSRRSSAILFSPKKQHDKNSGYNNIPIRGKRNNNGNNGSGSGNGNANENSSSHNSLKDKDIKVTFSSDKMSEFQMENSNSSNFQFHQPHSSSIANIGLGSIGAGSSTSENDDEITTIIANSQSHQDDDRGYVSPRRCLTSPSSQRGSPRLSPIFSPTFNQHLSHSSPCSPTHGGQGQPKESYARILATLKKIEDEERFNYGYMNVGVGRGDCDQPSISIPMHPNLPPGDQLIPSRPSTPNQIQIQGQGYGQSPLNQFNINNGNGNGQSNSSSPSPRKLNSRFTTSSNAIIVSSSSAAASSISCVDSHSHSHSSSPRIPSTSSTPRLPPLTLENNGIHGNSNNDDCGNINDENENENENHDDSNIKGTSDGNGDGGGSNGNNDNDGSEGSGPGSGSGCQSQLSQCNNQNQSQCPDQGQDQGQDHDQAQEQILTNNIHSVANSNSGHSGGSASDINRHIGVEENFSYEIHSARSFGLGDEPIRLSSCANEIRFRPPSIPSNSPRWGETSDEKTKNIFSFLDQVEKSDRETLFHLKQEKPVRSSDGFGGISTDGFRSNFTTRSEFPSHTMDSLIRKGSVALAREVILLERKIEETQHNITVLEETLINQRELNIRHIKNSERDLKKRLKLQQEEFELALTRHQAFVDQLISEKRALQDKCEKILRDLKDAEMKHQDQTKSLQSKHLDELKRIRRVQESSEKNRRMKWMGNKTQEIRETTIKGLEPELQRVIQRHQQEMSEMRAWHSNELQDMEERCSRKLLKQAQELREQLAQENEEGLRRDRELVNRRHESELEQLTQEMENQKRRHLQELHEERERFDIEQQKIRDLIQESIKKVEIKAEVELETMKEQYEAKLLAQERRHEAEIKTISDVHDAERESYVLNYSKKLEQAISERELILSQASKVEKEAELEEREKKLRQDFEKQWREQEDLNESRLKRLQEKFQVEIKEFEDAERELKTKFTVVKAELIAKEEEIYTLKTTVNLKEKQNAELTDGNMKMLEERASLTGVIRREFITQIENLEKDCMAVKSSVIELKAKQKLDHEQHLVELDKVRNEKDFELDKVGQRVVQAMARKEETIQELQKQLEKAAFRVSHLEELLEQQRKEYVKSMTLTTAAGSSKSKHK